jgi:hypothetical protein
LPVRAARARDEWRFLFICHIGETMLWSDKPSEQRWAKKGTKMKIALTVAAMLSSVTSHTAAAAQRGPGGTIPAQFHGRWAENARACRPTHFTTAITIDRTGWSSFEESGEVTRVGQVRGTTHHFRVANTAGADQSAGSLALRRVGPRLAITFHDDGQRPTNAILIRCRR